MRVTFSLVAVALALSACAGGATVDRYGSDSRTLAEDCRERGGVLSPTGLQSGNPARDNVCKMVAEPAIAGRDRANDAS